MLAAIKAIEVRTKNVQEMENKIYINTYISPISFLWWYLPF